MSKIPLVEVESINGILFFLCARKVCFWYAGQKVWFDAVKPYLLPSQT